LDKWIISRLNELVENGTESLEKYQVFDSARSIRDFINDFSTWYIRRSRDRFKSENEKERNEALSTTKFVLLKLVKYMAPFTPFFAEEVYQKIKSEADPESVHLCAWPEAKGFDASLINQMQKAREVVTQALELRQKAGIKVRQPLSSLTILEKFSQELLDIIADEVNVKKVVASSGADIKLDTTITDELKNEGIARDIIRGVQDARKTGRLSPNEKIKLTVCAPENIKTIIKSFETMIKVPTQVTGISYSNSKQEHVIKLDADELTITLVR
jgi:isoleucyl-tRNA synthetase